MSYNPELADAIINNNYAVQSVFDNVPEGIVSRKFLSKQEADSLLKVKVRSYLTSHSVVETLAVVGVVPFNSETAYIFNKKLPNCNTDDVTNVVMNTYESLMDCYVFYNGMISKRLLEQLESEYYERGGFNYESYHSFEDMVLNNVRKQRQREFRNQIVYEYFFKHGFVEVGKNKWTCEGVTIKQKEIQRCCIGYPSVKKHSNLDIDKVKMILIGSLFARFLQHISQLSDSSFGVVCNTGGVDKYRFTYFEITFK